jgi:hypothetical protein
LRIRKAWVVKWASLPSLPSQAVRPMAVRTNEGEAISTSSVGRLALLEKLVRQERAYRGGHCGSVCTGCLIVFSVGCLSKFTMGLPTSLDDPNLCTFSTELRKRLNLSWSQVLTPVASVKYQGSPNCNSNNGRGFYK